MPRYDHYAPSWTLRDAQIADMAGVQTLYTHHVLYGTASFEETPPGVEEMRARYEAVLAAGLPYLVAVEEGEVIGFCYATPYRPRPAYRYTLENSIYMAEGAAGRGIGTDLLRTLIARCERGPWRQMLAVIGGSDNAGSIALHRKCGFEPAGTFRSVGFKFGAWRDTVLMQLALGPGDRTHPIT
ncbi:MULTISPECIES: GNAT family N-acetyltransferase [Halomonadaceae]|uniref:GNAT family N-acetyltransferase n=1 Tax=Halomonadaceae TaxID=28256 RepID=UPI0015972F08|nr:MULTISPECIES: GNAT family N-acetyltransferase [Halomonas]QJQ96180.1 N-acetyltransferase [Halomonas sp. PA5]